MTVDIVGVGQCVMDRIVRVDTLPAPGRHCDVQSEVEVGGGMTANAMVAAAHLGLRAALIAAIGDDEAGMRVRRDLAAEGVDTRGLLVRREARTPSWMMFFDGAGDRVVVLFNRETMQSPAAAVHAVRLARARGLKVACDMQAALATYEQIGIREGHIRDVLDRADLFMPSLAGLLSLTRESAPRAALAQLMARYPQMTMALTLGADGSLIASGGAIHAVPAFPVAMVDTVGAGDTYHAALVYGLYFQGWVLAQAGRFASAAAAIKCTRVGGRSGPTRAEVDSFLAAQ